MDGATGCATNDKGGADGRVTPIFNKLEICCESH